MGLNSDLKYWIALSTNLNIGARTFQKLMFGFSSMEEVWHASDKDFERKKINPKIVGFIKEARKKDPDLELQKIENLGISAITIKDKVYPKILKEIADAPALLYVKGEMLRDNELALAVVGARKFSPYGEQVIGKIIPSLVESGLVIVSGLALGIDSLAHRATVDNKGRTIAVLGNGLDSIYPSVNNHLAHEIVKSGGALISEFPIGTPSYKYNFPFRNRIIAGLSLGTLVVEAAQESGSLITANCALEYNREVFSVPGDINRETSEGPNNLIKMGSKLVTSADDILLELNIDKKSEHIKAKEIIPDSKEEAEILAHLGTDPVHVDKIAHLAKLDIVKVNQTLTLMEMKGRIKNIGGSQYIICR